MDKVSLSFQGAAPEQILEALNICARQRPAESQALLPCAEPGGERQARSTLKLPQLSFHLCEKISNVFEKYPQLKKWISLKSAVVHLLLKIGN